MNKRRRFKAKRRRRMERWRRGFMLDRKLSAIVAQYASSLMPPDYVTALLPVRRFTYFEYSKADWFNGNGTVAQTVEH